MTASMIAPETYQGTGFGKLMIAGEYAVTRPLRRAIVVAVDRRVTATVAPSPKPSVTVSSQQRTDEISIEDLRGSGPPASLVTTQNQYAVRVIAKAAALAQVTGAAIARGADISIGSNLDEPASRVKYGLGSSSAVTVALAAALNEFLGLRLDRRGLWKLSYLSTIETNPRASGADLAAALYGGWLCYRSPDRAWLEDCLTHRDLAEIVHDDWPGLEIRALSRPPHASRLVVGWSGSAAVTADLVATATSRLTTGFLDRSDETVEQLAKALVAADEPATALYVRQAQALLQELDTPAIGIMTDQLRAMLSASAELGVPSKISGAGGGDCCIAFPSGVQEHAALIQRWNDSGFSVLPLCASPEAEGQHE